MTTRIDGVYNPRLVSCDPGLDCSGWACFRKGLWASSPTVGLARLEQHGRIETGPGIPLQERLVFIHVSFKAVLTDTGAKEVVIEVPSKAGQYDRTGKKNATALANLERVIGVLIVAAAEVVGHENVRLIRAPAGQWAKKEHRHEWLRSVGREAGIELPVGPRGGKQEDVWDAIWNGLQVLRTPPVLEVGRA